MLKSSCQVTTAPNASKIARIGTRTRPVRITGATSIVKGAPLIKTLMGRAVVCATGGMTMPVTANKATIAKHRRVLFLTDLILLIPNFCRKGIH